MTCETPEGNSITWSNIKRNRKQSYLTVTYIIVRTLCVWFPNSNLYSGMFRQAWGIPSLYCHPSIQGDRKYYLQWTVYLSTLSIGYLLQLFSLSILGVGYVMPFCLWGMSQLLNVLRLVSLGGHPSVIFFIQNHPRESFIFSQFFVQT